MAMDSAEVRDEFDDVSQAGPAGKSQQPLVVEVDTLIDRPDLGPGCSTLVAAGDKVPPHLADLPRRPREAKGRKR